TSLAPTWTILPSATGEQAPPQQLLATMGECGIRALRLFPSDHRYFLDALSWQDQVPLYAERRIPLFVKAGLDRVADFLRAFPSATVTTATSRDCWRRCRGYAARTSSGSFSATGPSIRI